MARRSRGRVRRIRHCVRRRLLTTAVHGHVVPAFRACRRRKCQYACDQAKRTPRRQEASNWDRKPHVRSAARGRVRESFSLDGTSRRARRKANTGMAKGRESRALRSAEPLATLAFNGDRQDYPNRELPGARRGVSVPARSFPGSGSSARGMAGRRRSQLRLVPGSPDRPAGSGSRSPGALRVPQSRVWMAMCST